MKSCRACGADSLRPILDLGRMPLAGGFLAPGEEKEEKRYALVTHVCDRCSLVQIADAIDPEILFQNYSFSSSTVGPLITHFKDYARWLKVRFDPTVVVEFGCNDGILLEPLQALGITAVGVDVSRNITEIARSKGLHALSGYFDADAASEIERSYGKADVVTGSNAFAHNARPERILEAARRLLKPQGFLCLEVMYAGDLLEKWQWDTLYHEHLTFYSLRTLGTLLERHGFHIFHAERLPMHGGSLRVAASIDDRRSPTQELRTIEEHERSLKLNEPGTWLAFGKDVRRKIDVVGENLLRLSQGRKVWGYGAAGKATLWVNACGMNYLRGMVDSSPLRAGKLMPGVHTPIVGPDEMKKDSPDYVFITAWNYADAIVKKEDWYKGYWVTPLPEMRVF